MGQGPRERQRPRKPWEDPPRPGPTVMVDIDVVASMAKFQYLIDKPLYKDRDWKQFHREFRRADQVKNGARLVRALDDAGLVIAWSATRLDQFAKATDNWIRAHQLPAGQLECRSLFKDGNRAVELVKRRQWWRWNDKYADTNPIVAWIDTDPASVEALRGDGCPVWLFPDIYDNTRLETLVPTLAAGPEPVDVLAERMAAARPAWDTDEKVWQAKRAEWAKKHMQRLRTRQAETRGQR